ncbi:MAG: YIP1 family protein [Rhodobacteraceae bacterium]|nr:YIP1 family protein [Paracoccaceae bacterium]|tara:strand:- start:836 stop:1426 length:591 start_codon:yes stop_codon:yes gene_type:complete
MTGADVMPLIVTTLRDPKEAARLIGTLNLNRDVLWTALALVAAINTLVISVLMSFAGQGVQLPGYFNMPLVLFVLIAGVLVVYVQAIFWAGRALGGQGDLGHLLALVIWLQTLRAGAQLIVFALAGLFPGLSLLMSVLIGVWGLWILLHFITAALGLPSLLHALGTLVLGAVGLVLGLGILLSLVGAVAQGVLPNV